MPTYGEWQKEVSPSAKSIKKNPPSPCLLLPLHPVSLRVVPLKAAKPVPSEAERKAAIAATLKQKQQDKAQQRQEKEEQVLCASM